MNCSFRNLGQACEFWGGIMRKGLWVLHIFSGATSNTHSFETKHSLANKGVNFHSKLVQRISINLRSNQAGKIAVRSQLIHRLRYFDSDCSWDLFSCEEAVATAFIIYCKPNNSRKSGNAGEIKLCDKWFGFFPLTIMIWPEQPQLRDWGGALGLLIIHARQRLKGRQRNRRERDETENMTGC